MHSDTIGDLITIIDEKGWLVMHSDTRGLEIQKDDELDVFENDAAAVEHVTTKACQGSDPHLSVIIHIHGINKASQP